MLKKSIFGILFGAFLTLGLWALLPQDANAGPGDGRGKQYWKCRWKIACDGSHEFQCSTGGSCQTSFF